MREKNTNLVNLIVGLLSILFLVAFVGFIFKFTNGFNEDLKTFYIEHNGKQIVATDSQMMFDTEIEYRFDCKYISNLDNNTFNLKVVPNVTEETDFSYTVDGKSHKWSEVEDLTSCFNLNKQANYFIVSFPAYFSMQGVLNSLYPESQVVISDTLSLYQYYYTLHVSNYNEKINYYIDFNVGVADLTHGYDITFVVDGVTVKTERVIEDTLITPPESPTKRGYTFDGWVNTSNSIIDFTTYTACEKMTFTAKFSLNTINVSFNFESESSSSGGDTGSGGTEFSVTTCSATPYWSGVIDDSLYGTISPSSVALSVENQTATIPFTLNSGYTYKGIEVNTSSSGGGTVTPYSLTSYPFGVSVSGSTITITLNSAPTISSSYSLSILVSGSSSSGGSSGGVDL